MTFEAKPTSVVVSPLDVCVLTHGAYLFGSVYSLLQSAPRQIISTIVVSGSNHPYLDLLLAVFGVDKRSKRHVDRTLDKHT